MVAEKIIIVTELERLKRQENPEQKTSLPPRELFPSSTQKGFGGSPVSPTAASLVLFNNVHLNNTGTVSASIESETAEEKKAPNQTNCYLQKRETELKQDNMLLAAQIESAHDLMTEKTRVFVILQGITRPDAAMVHVKGLPSTTLKINILK